MGGTVLRRRGRRLGTIVGAAGVIVGLLASPAMALTPIQDKRASLPWLGAATTAETVAPDGIGHYRHYEHGSIYWKSTIGPHEVHGLIRQKWAQLGWEKNANLGYPISDEKPTKSGSANRYNDFENGVVYWKSGASSATVLSKNVLASKTFAQMKTLITNEVKKRLPSKVDGHSIYVTNICICGPEPILTPNFATYFLPTTDYAFSGSNTTGTVRNRLYKVQVSFGITVDGSADPDVTLNLRLYVGKSGNNVVVKIYPQWSYHVSVPWPTSWFVDASTIGNAVKGVITPMLGTTVSTTAVPWNVLSVKVEPNGDLNTYTQD